MKVKLRVEKVIGICVIISGFVLIGLFSIFNSTGKDNPIQTKNGINEKNPLLAGPATPRCDCL